MSREDRGQGPVDPVLKMAMLVLAHQKFTSQSGQALEGAQGVSLFKLHQSFGFLNCRVGYMWVLLEI